MESQAPNAEAFISKLNTLEKPASPENRRTHVSENLRDLDELSYAQQLSALNAALIDTKTRKRSSLQTSDEDDARQIIEAKNQAERQPALNLQIAKAYLAGSDSSISNGLTETAFDVAHIDRFRVGDQIRLASSAEVMLVPAM